MHIDRREVQQLVDQDLSRRRLPEFRIKADPARFKEGGQLSDSVLLTHVGACCCERQLNAAFPRILLQVAHKVRHKCNALNRDR